MTLSSCCGEMRAEQREGGSGGKRKSSAASQKEREKERERERGRENERTGAIVILSHYHLD